MSEIEVREKTQESLDRDSKELKKCQKLLSKEKAEHEATKKQLEILEKEHKL